MKKKKKLIIILSSVTGAVVLLAIALAACSGMALKSPIDEDEIPTGTIELSEQYGQHESDEAEESTKADTESDSAESESYSDTDNGAESVEEDTNVDVESDTSASPLRFTSNNNGTCSVSGIGDVSDSYLSIPLKSPDGDVVIAIEEKAFFGNKTLKAVDIPSTVSDIGEMAFADCPELIYISVDDGNKAFCDVGGILYSADMTTLLAYPAANGSSSITIPESVKSISQMAFYGCNTLKVICFEGTVAEWSKITVGDMNYGLYYASIICSDTEK